MDQTAIIIILSLLRKYLIHISITPNYHSYNPALFFLSFFFLCFFSFFNCIELCMEMKFLCSCIMDHVSVECAAFCIVWCAFTAGMTALGPLFLHFQLHYFIALWLSAFIQKSSLCLSVTYLRIAAIKAWMRKER